MSVTLWLVFARAIGFFSRAPGLSRQSVPPQIRVGLAFVLAVAVAPSVPHVRATDALVLLGALLGETLVGLLFGAAATLAAEAAAGAGRILDDFVGLRASIPQIAVAPPGLGALWTLVFTAGFFALGGVDVLVSAFAHSFDLVPAGMAPAAGVLRKTGLGFGTAFARLALDLAAPAICVALCIHLGLATLVRVVPRFAHLSLAYPVAYAGVLLAAFLSLSTLRELASAR